MNMKRFSMMRLVVVLIAIACMMSLLSACGGKGDRHECTYGADVTIKVGTSAKCTEIQHTCTVCEKTEVVSSTKHAYEVSDPQVVYKGEEAKGYMQTSTCKVCGYQYSRWLTDTEISDAGLPSVKELNTKHEWTQTESEATKAEYEAFIGKADDVPVDEGYIATYWKTVRSCSHCNETETVIQRRDVVDPNYKPDDGGSTEPTIPEPDEGDKECEHKYETKTVAPTCTEKGYTQYTCSKCGKSYTSDYTNATGHKFGSWTTKAATCTANGSKTRSCANCGKVETETIKATGHTMGSWSTTKKATCDTNGTKTRKCSACGHTETETIPATNHNWDEGKVTTTPTSCSDMGIKTYTCKTCGKTKTEQIKGSHTFGEWKYEEYTYKQDGYDRVSHRKVRTCTKCGYKEYGNTPDHSCKKGSSNHTVTTIKEGTCTTPAKMRSTCKICGWYVDYDGKKGSHTIKTETRHLTDYGAYTNELDARIDTCTSCGATDTVYIKGEGWSDYNRYAVSIALTGGDNFSLEHPEYQTVKRNFVYDSNGYVKQFTVYWWYNGQRYSQVINCDKASMIAWFAEYGMTATGSETFQIKASGTKVQPYKISWTG
jgi:transposase-like protein